MYYDRSDEAWATIHQIYQDADARRLAAEARAGKTKDEPRKVARARAWWRVPSFRGRAFVS